MPLILSTPPPNAASLIADAISRLSMAQGVARTVTDVSDPSQLSCALPHKVYTLGASEIAQGRHLTQSRLIAWRFLILNRLTLVGAIELSCDSVGGNLRFSSLDTGPFGPWTRDAVARAEKMDRVVNGSYELRVLKAPSVYAMAVWLKNLKPGEDIVLPIGTGLRTPVTRIDTLTGGAAPTQSATDYLQGLQSAAQDALRFDNSPQPPSPVQKKSPPSPRRRP